MKKFLSALCATALTAAVGITGVIPATAAPAYVPQVQSTGQSDVIQVREKFKWKKGQRRGGKQWRSGSRHSQWRQGHRRGNGWYNGHRGYRYKRPGYRYHDGWWYPGGAFIAGAIIGGAIANSNNNYARSGSSSHVEWCYDRYRSYRAYDNTYQPYNGPRRQCYSPYS